jgi:signal transduction histidine kinase
VADERHPTLAEARALLEATARLTVDPNDPDIMQAILECAVALFDKADEGIIVARGAEDGPLGVVACSAGYRPEAWDLSFKPGEGAPGLVFYAQRPLLWAGAGAVDSVVATTSPANRDVIERTIAKLSAGGRSVMCAPLVARGEIIGAIQLDHWADDRAFTQWELDVLNTVAAGPLAAALDNALLFGELREQRAQTQDLLRRMIAVQEEERASVARDLHDVIAQSFTALLVALRNLGAAVRGIPEAQHLTSYLAQVDDDVQQAMTATRDLATSLHPAILDDLGLASAIEWAAHNLLGGSGVDFSFALDGEGLARLPAATATMAYRVVHEALTNVVRHSGARYVEVTARSGARRVSLRVADDGTGLPDGASGSGPAGFGLRAMRERAELAGAGLGIGRQAGGGTEVVLTIPIGPGGGAEQK